MKKKLIKILLILVIYVNFTNIAFASNLNFSDDRGILLYEEKSNTVLYEKNSEKKFFPASTTKIMTALLVLENLRMEDKITVGDEITLISKDSSKANLQQGEVLTVEELLHGLLVASGNDVAYTFARSVGGQEEGKTKATDAITYFVDMMNNRAKELGAKNTHFVNPHGLHNVDHYSTPEDMLIITKELLKHDEVKDIVSKKIYTTQSSLTTHEWVSTNVFLHSRWDVIPNLGLKGVNQYYTKEVNGIKTGFTDQAGRCIIFSAQKDGLDLIGLIYHSTYEEIWQEGIKLLDFAAKNYEYVDLVEKDVEIASLVVSNPRDTSLNTLSVITKENIPMLVETEHKEDIYKTKTIKYDEKILQFNEDKTVKLKNDIQSDQIIGRVTYEVEGKIIESELYSAKNVEKRFSLDFIFHWLIILLSIVFLLVVGRLRIVKKRRRKRRRNKIRRK